ncbi:MAG: amidohydrolase family protein [Cyclobacteriaceae bacterium]
MRIDAHQHFWKFDPVRDSWITEDMGVIKRDFLPGDLEPMLQDTGIGGTISVQASQSTTETDFLLRLARNHDFIKGVVGWVDLKDEGVIDQLEFYKRNPKFKGVRHILQAESKGFMTDTKFIWGLRRLYSQDLTYDILIYEKQLEEVCDLVRLLPEMRLVIDHIGKPNIKDSSFDQWAKYMKELSQYPHVYAKLSGMITEADWNNWTEDDLQPYVDFMLTHFGADRLMYGSDWPVCKVAGSYMEVHSAMLACISELSFGDQEKIMGMTAAKFYKL